MSDHPQILAASPAALATPEHGDGAIIAAAAGIRDLQERRRVAWARYSELDDRYRALLPPAPPEPDPKEIDKRVIKVMKTFSEITPEIEAVLATQRSKTEKRMRAARAAWQKTSDRIADELGVQKASDETDRLYEEISDALDELATVQAVTLQGLIAKASVFEPTPDSEPRDLHHDALAASVMRDLAAMSGGHDPDAELITLVKRYHEHDLLEDESQQYLAIGAKMRRAIVGMRAATFRGLMAKVSVSICTAGILEDREQELKDDVSTGRADCEEVEASCVHDLAHLAEAAGLLRPDR